MKITGVISLKCHQNNSSLGIKCEKENFKVRTIKRNKERKSHKRNNSPTICQKDMTILCMDIPKTA